MRRGVVPGLLGIALLTASTSAGQTAATDFVDAERGLSLDQAVARALAREPSLRAAKTAIDAARGMQQQAGARENPSLTMDLRGEPGGTDNQTMFTVEWPLALYRRSGRQAVADRELAATELSVADRERILRAEVRARYGDALVAVRDLQVLQQLGDALRRQRDLLRARVEEGASPPIERDLVAIEVNRLEADRLMQVGRAERAMLELKRAIGMSPDEDVRLRDLLEDIVMRDAVPNLPAGGDLESRRPDVREAAARAAVAEAKVDLAERNGRFDMTLFGGYTRMVTGFSQFGVSPAGVPERVHGVFHYVGAGATLTLPFLNRNSGAIAAAQAERRGAVALQEAVSIAARTEIEAARRLDQRTHEAVRLLGGDTRTLASQNLAVVQQSYELGRTSVFEALAEQRRYLDFERAYTQTLQAAYESRTALSRAIGEQP
jgi:cobalt-zinc-cadmium efflux system outer membrane protein